MVGVVRLKWCSAYTPCSAITMPFVGIVEAREWPVIQNQFLIYSFDKMMQRNLWVKFGKNIKFCAGISKYYLNLYFCNYSFKSYFFYKQMDTTLTVKVVDHG